MIVVHVFNGRCCRLWYGEAFSRHLEWYVPVKMLGVGDVCLVLYLKDSKYVSFAVLACVHVCVSCLVLTCVSFQRPKAPSAGDYVSRSSALSSKSSSPDSNYRHQPQATRPRSAVSSPFLSPPTRPTKGELLRLLQSVIEERLTLVLLYVVDGPNMALTSLNFLFPNDRVTDCLLQSSVSILSVVWYLKCHFLSRSSLRIRAGLAVAID